MPASVPLCLWKASVGNACTYIPRVDDKVFYFPAGHSELSSSPIDIASEEPPVSAATAATVHCQIVEVQLLADNDTDEAFYRILLQPCPYHGPISKPSSAVTPPPPPEEEAISEVSWFSKVLTQSDAHNGGGYSVPRACAESLFPPLNYADDTPLQTLSVTDMHGTVWEFRHIFRGNPKRHLLTTGWSRFVTGKNLTKEDSVVFMKVGVEEELFVGIRRRRMGELRGRDEVVNTMRKAWAGETFEVTYYPRKGTLEFVVGVDAVERVVCERWAPGVRVKMAVEMEDSRKIWVHGCISFIDFRKFPWRMLHVKWDDPNTLLNEEPLNPWQVVLDAMTTQFQPNFHPTNIVTLLEALEQHRPYNFNNFPTSDVFQFSSGNGTTKDLEELPEILSGTPSPLDNNTSKNNNSKDLKDSSNGGSPSTSSDHKKPITIRLFGNDIQVNPDKEDHNKKKN